MIALIALGAVVATAGTAVAWLPRVGRSREAATVALVVGAAVLGSVAAVPGTPVARGEDLARLLPVALAVVCVLGGSPVTVAVLRLADRESAGRAAATFEGAAQVLRGGVWIGAFERTAIFAALLAGWPEGIAVVLALKGLGRYSELRADGASHIGGASPVSSGVAERFIIGTFGSALWAAGCAGVWVGLVA